MEKYRLGLVFVIAGLASLPLFQGEGSAFTLQDDNKGWENLMPGRDLKGWRRVPIAPDTKPNPKNPWKMDPSGKILQCDGVGFKEMFLYHKEFKDGTFHVEWRFRKVADKTDYNAGVYVRNSADGKIWHQAQVAHVTKRPQMADLFGETLVDSQLQKFLVPGRGTNFILPPGEWNTYDIICKGPRLTVAVNRKIATIWNHCQVGKGLVGLQAEYFFIEFRNMKFKPQE